LEKGRRRAAESPPAHHRPRGERYELVEGKTPEITVEGARKLLKSIGTDLLEQGVALEDVQRLAGHADPRTTRLYDRRDTKITRNIVERISI
jgi:integrase